jgi:hypothetical protein
MDSKNNEWTDEERKRVVDVFAWLLKEDRKQNPDLYKKVPLEKGRSESDMSSQKSFMGQ